MAKKRKSKHEQRSDTAPIDTYNNQSDIEVKEQKSQESSEKENSK
jgi:hypothetical protein|tara:strand:+ start:1340 stop:1474 length:135 start_codon:yes stop_codon:yes gene_type:complete